MYDLLKTNMSNLPAAFAVALSIPPAIFSAIGVLGMVLMGIFSQLVKELAQKESMTETRKAENQMLGGGRG